MDVYNTGSEYVNRRFRKTMRLGFWLLAAATAVSPTWAASGRDLWMDNCVRCHGVDGKGATKQGRKLKLKDLTSARMKARLDEQRIAEAISEGSQDSSGKERMPAFGEKLSAEQQTELVRFVRQLVEGAP